MHILTDIFMFAAYVTWCKGYEGKNVFFFKEFEYLSSATMTTEILLESICLLISLQERVFSLLLSTCTASLKKVRLDV